MHLILAVLGLCCYTGFSLVAARGDEPPVAVYGFLTAAASLVKEHRLNSCGAWAYLLRGMWHLPRSGIELVSPALAGRFFTTKPPGKPTNS